MTIQSQSSGTLVTGQAAVSPTIPAPLAGSGAGHLLILVVYTKPQTATINTPAGWTLLVTATSANGALQAADTGDTKVALFYKEAVGGESGTVTVNITSGNSSGGRIMRFSRDLAEWDIVGGIGADNTGGTAWSATMGGSPTWDVGDVIIGSCCLPTDVAITWASETFTRTGLTFGGLNTTGSTVNGLGNDSQYRTTWMTVASGTATGGPQWTATLSGTTTNAYGAAAFMRLREVSGSTDWPGDATLDITASIVDAGATIDYGAAAVPVAVTVATAATATTTQLGQASLTVTAALSAAGARVQQGAASLPATATITAAAVRGAQGAATLPITAGITAAATAAGTTAADATLAVTAGISSAARITATAQATLAVTAATTAAATRAAAATATLPVTATLSATAARTAAGTVSLAVAAAIAAAGSLGAQAAASSLAATATITAAGATGAVASLGVSAAITAAAVITRAGAASLTVTAAITTAGTYTGRAATTLPVTATVTAGATAIWRTTAALLAAATITATAQVLAAYEPAYVSVEGQGAAWLLPAGQSAESSTEGASAGTGHEGASIASGALG